MLGPISGDVPFRPSRSVVIPRRRAAAEKRRELVNLGLRERAARSASACPNAELFAVLVSHLRGDACPDEVDLDWANYAVSVYTDPEFNWTHDHWRLDDSQRVFALRTIEQGGGALSKEQLIAAGVKDSQLRYLSRVTPAPSGAPILRRVGRGNEARFSAIECPHCQGRATHSVVTPETRPGVLCTSCWRAPFEGSPVFPEWYRTSL